METDMNMGEQQEQQEQPMQMSDGEEHMETNVNQPSSSFYNNEFKTINTNERQQVQNRDEGVLFPDAPDAHRKKPQLY